MSMRIGELASLAKLAPSALRYYERAGLLGPAERTDAGYRVYGDEAVRRLAFIQRAQAIGLSIREIRELVRSPDADTAAERAALRHVVAHKVRQTQRRIDELAVLKSELESLYVRLVRAPGPVCGHVGDCGCWLPTEEEVMTMSQEVEFVMDCGCSDCCDSCGCGCDCGSGSK